MNPLNSPLFRQIVLIGALVGMTYSCFNQRYEKRQVKESLTHQEAVNDTLRIINRDLVSQRDRAYAFADSVNKKRLTDREELKTMVEALPASKQSELVRSTLAKLYPEE